MSKAQLRTMRNTHLIFILIIAFAITFFSCVNEKQKLRPNVLFIAVDDLRPEVNSFGAKQIKSPNIDRLSSEGLSFSRAYCNVPVCGASRASLLTGIKPTKNRFVTYHTYAQDDAPGAISIPQHFKNNGYHTISNGKIFHHTDDLLESWSEVPWKPTARKGNWRDYVTDKNLIVADSLEDGRAWPYEMADAHDTVYFDGLMTQKTMRDLHRLKEMDRPFFLAAGFLKPHLPFNAPQKYWDMYPAESISLPENYYRPEHAPDAAIHNFGELRNYFGVPKEGPVSDEMALTLIRGYYACVSYTDAQIGKLLNTLDELGLRENTIVILWGDHGWQLGEHKLWCKHSNFDIAMRVPMIISAPGYSGGVKTNALVEYIDIFPSLCELAGLNLPSQLHGRSFESLMNNPDQKFKEVIYARYGKGESIKTDRYLYTEWYNKEDELYGRMLYDHSTDPDENVNISEFPENEVLVDSLSNILHNEMESAFDIKL
jgi:iduronate 2-sulfatase